MVPKDTVQSPTPPQSLTKRLLEAISSAAKQTFNMRTTTSPSVSPKKKKGQVESQSAICTTINQANPQGLMKFFKQSTHEEHDKQVWRHTAEEDKCAQDHQEMNDALKRRCSEKAKEGAQEWQQKHHQAIYDSEIAKGKCSPGGTKQKNKRSVLLYMSLDLQLKFIIIST
jgi:hypothetical protein